MKNQQSTPFRRIHPVILSLSLLALLPPHCSAQSTDNQAGSVFNVKAHGATGDGHTDDIAANNTGTFISAKNWGVITVQHTPATSGGTFQLWCAP